MKIRSGEQKSAQQVVSKKEKVKVSAWFTNRSSMVFQFLHNKKGVLGLLMLSISVFIAILAPVLIHHDPLTFLVRDASMVNHPPNWEFPLGTDVLGRDVYSQLIWGFRNALVISMPSAVIIGVLGTMVGLASGYYGGVLDSILQRISITFLLLPSIPFVALIVHSWGAVQVKLALILGVSICLWPTAARAIRAEVKSVKTRVFIEAAKVAGADTRRIIFHHIFPNVQHLTFLYMTVGVAFALSLEATVSFLGLGNVHIVTWGQMLSFTFMATRRTMTWWTILPPGLAIAYMVLSSFLISEGVRESVGKTTFMV
jgi:peptide/nickel transport system permease protein